MEGLHVISFFFGRGGGQDRSQPVSIKDLTSMLGRFWPIFALK